MVSYPPFMYLRIPVFKEKQMLPSRSFVFCLFALICGMFTSILFGQDYSGFNLQPGETLIAIDGVPVGQTVCRNGQCTPVRSTIKAVAEVLSPEKISGFENIPLAPGEVLIEVNGVPVTQRTPIRNVLSAAANIVTSPFEVMADARAYAHAKREAELQANRKNRSYSWNCSRMPSFWCRLIFFNIVSKSLHFQPYFGCTCLCNWS